MKHIHLFQNIGGGCRLDLNSNQDCDDDYKCECGVGFKAYSSQKVHFQMPKYIAGKEEPEKIDINME